MMDFTTRFNLWKDVLLKPVDTLGAQAAKSEMGLLEGVVNLGLAVLTSMAIAMAISLLFLLVGGQFSVFSIVGMIVGVALVMIVMIVAIALSLIVTAIEYAVAMVLGGKAAYGHFYYMLTLPHAPIFLLIMLLSAVPFAGILAGFVLSVYGLYLTTLAIQKTYGFGTLKAVAVWLVPLIIIGVIAMVLVGAMLATVLAGLMSLRR